MAIEVRRDGCNDQKSSPAAGRIRGTSGHRGGREGAFRRKAEERTVIILGKWVGLATPSSGRILRVSSESTRYPRN
jgi:hypothetical protein